MGNILRAQRRFAYLMGNLKEKSMINRRKIDGKSMRYHRSIIRLNFIKYARHESITLKISDISLLSEFKYDMYLSIARVAYN